MLKPVQGDSLALIEANIAGQKTDGVIEEKVEHVAEIQTDGSIIDAVTLTRAHHGVKGEPFRGVRNVSYLRLYVPQGSELISADGFEAPADTLFKKPEEGDGDSPFSGNADMKKLSNGMSVGIEAGRTIFGGWLQLDPGKTQTVTYRYLLPFTVQDLRLRLNPDRPQTISENQGAYMLLLTSQSGKSSRHIHSIVRLPSTWRSAWQRGAALNGKSDMAYDGMWDRDHVIAAFVEPEGESHEEK
jgi:hypothetical protein